MAQRSITRPSTPLSAFRDLRLERLTVYSCNKFHSSSRFLGFPTPVRLSVRVVDSSPTFAKRLLSFDKGFAGAPVFCGKRRRCCHYDRENRPGCNWTRSNDAWEHESPLPPSNSGAFNVKYPITNVAQKPRSRATEKMAACFTFPGTIPEPLHFFFLLEETERKKNKKTTSYVSCYCYGARCWPWGAAATRAGAMVRPWLTS